MLNAVRPRRLLLNGFDFDSLRLESAADLRNEFERMGVIAMHADRVGLDRDGLSACAFDGALLDGANGAPHGELLVGDERIGAASGHKRSLVGVVSVGEELLGDGETARAARFDELAVRKADQHEFGIDIADRLRDGGGEVGINRSAVVELPMRFHVIELDALRSAEPGERADLVNREGIRFFGREVEVATAEALQIGIARVRPNGDACVCGHGNGLLHDERVSRVHAARDVAARNERNDLCVEAEGVATEAFAEIAVEIDAGHGCLHRLVSSKGLF